MEREIELGGGGRRRRFEAGLNGGAGSRSRQRRRGNDAGPESRTLDGDAAPPRLLLRGVDFAPDTQEPDATEDHAGLEFVPDSEDDCGDDGLSRYDSDEPKFVPDSLIGTEVEVVPDSVLDDVAEDPVGAQEVEKAEDSVDVDGQLDDNEVCFSMLRILLPAYFRIPGNENLGL